MSGPQGGYLSMIGIFGSDDESRSADRFRQEPFGKYLHNVWDICAPPAFLRLAYMYRRMLGLFARTRNRVLLRQDFFDVDGKIPRLITGGSESWYQTVKLCVGSVRPRSSARSSEYPGI